MLALFAFAFTGSSRGCTVEDQLTYIFTIIAFILGLILAIMIFMRRKRNTAQVQSSTSSNSIMKAIGGLLGLVVVGYVVFMMFIIFWISAPSC